MTEQPPSAPARPPPLPPSQPTATLPAPRVVRPNRFRLSMVWLVPIIALVIGASLAVRSILATGPRIEIDFNTAEGLEAGKTEVRYKEVVIGRVEAISLRDDRQRVVVTVQLARSAAGVARQDTQFWVVRPRIGTSGVSGLGTLFSGAYIGVDAGVSELERDRFVGLEAPPFMLRGEPGGSYALVADDLGSLDVGSPIYYRRTRVGRVVGYALDTKRDELTVKIFIEAPYQSLVTPQTRFWNASGVDLSLNANGLTLDTQTLSSVLAGGVSFEHLPDGGPATPAADGSRFALFNDRKSALAPPLGQAVPVRMVFDQSVRGLTVGAPVDFLGVDIGAVRSITLRRDMRRKRFPVDVVADVYPLRLGTLRSELLRSAAPGDDKTQRSPPAAASASAPKPREEPDVDASAIRRLAAQGLKAQMRTGNFLTGQLYVALDFFPDDAAAATRFPTDGDRSAKPPKPGSKRALRAERQARLVAEADAHAGTLAGAQGMLTLPTVSGTLSEIQPQVAQIVQKLSRIPFDDLGRGLKGTIDQANATLSQLTPDARRALADVSATLNRAQTSLDQLDRNLLQESAPVQQRADQTLAEIQRAAQSVRVLTDYLQRHPESLLRGKPADAPLASGRGNARASPGSSPQPPMPLSGGPATAPPRNPP